MTQTTSSRGWIRTVATVWGGELFSVLTSSVLQMGLIWHITTTTKSALAVTLASLVGFCQRRFSDHLLELLLTVSVFRW